MTLDLALVDAGLLFGAGLIGSAFNAVAGGGTFFTFPTFLSTGVAAVVANASNAVAIWPGRVLSIAAYRRELDRQLKRALWTGAVCLAGGLTGAWLLLSSGVKDIQELNGLKNLLVTVVTSVAVATFVANGVVSWPGTIAMMAGALIGGYGGGYLARHIPARILRKIVIGFGFFLSAYYFTDIYLR